MQTGFRTPSPLQIHPPKILPPPQKGVVVQDASPHKLHAFTVSRQLPQADTPVNTLVTHTVVPPSSSPPRAALVKHTVVSSCSSPPRAGSTSIAATKHRNSLTLRTNTRRISNLSIASIFSDGGSIQVMDSPCVSRARGVTFAESDTGSGVHQSVCSIQPYEEIYGIHPRLFNFGANGEILVGHPTGAAPMMGQQLPVPQPFAQNVLQQAPAPSSVMLSCHPQQLGQRGNQGGTLPVVKESSLEKDNPTPDSSPRSPTGAKTHERKDKVKFAPDTPDTCEDSDYEFSDEEDEDADVSGCLWLRCRESVCRR